MGYIHMHGGIDSHGKYYCKPLYSNIYARGFFPASLSGLTKVHKIKQHGEIPTLKHLNSYSLY